MGGGGMEKAVDGVDGRGLGVYIPQWQGGNRSAARTILLKAGKERGVPWSGWALDCWLGGGGGGWTGVGLLGGVVVGE
jgi:hypothetical protein